MQGKKSASRVCLRALLAAGAAYASAASAGSTVTFSTTGACRGEIESLRIHGSQFRSDSQMEGQSMSLLYDGVERLMTTLMHEQRQFMQTEVDEDALDYQADVAHSTGNYMDKQLEKIEAQTAQQCAEMRKQGMECPQMDLRGMMQGMMVSRMPAWRDLGRDGLEAGVACRWWERSQGGVKVGEECTAKVATLPIGERDLRGLQRGLEVMHRYGGNMMGMVRGLTGADAPQSEMPKDGLVVAQVCFGSDGSESGRATAQFATATFDDAVFAVPEGYSQMRMDEPAQ